MFLSLLSSTLWPYAILAGVASGILTVVFSLVYSGGRVAGIGGAVVSAVLTIIVGTVFVLGFSGHFAYWADSGYIILTLIAMGLASGFVYVSVVEHDSRGAEMGGAMGALGVVAALIIMISQPYIFAPSGICNQAKNIPVITDLLRIEEKGATGLPEKDPNQTVVVSPKFAYNLANNQVPKTINTVLKVEDYAYLQGVRGRPFYVLNTSAANWNDYTRLLGAVTPGYLLVEADRENPEAKWQPLPAGKEIRYIKEATIFSDFDIDLVKYLYELQRGVVIEELDGVEVDDDFTPWYVGTAMRPSDQAGVKVWYPVWVVVLDPRTGTWKEYPLNQVPEWINNVLPAKTASELVQWYAEYGDPQYPGPCRPTGGSAFQYKIDKGPIRKWDGKRTFLQYVLTSQQKDTVATKILHVYPRELRAEAYTINSSIPTAIEKLVETRAKNIYPSINLDAVQVELSWVSGAQVWEFVLENNGKTWGLAMMRTEDTLSLNVNNVIMGPTRADVYSRMRALISREAGKSGKEQIDNSKTQVQIRGTLIAKGYPVIPAGGGESFLLFVVQEASGKTHIFRVRAEDLTAQLMQVGHVLTVTADAVATDNIETVIAIQNETFKLK